MSKCHLSLLESMWGLHLVIEGGPHLHIQFHEIFTSNFSRPWFSRTHLFSRRSPFSRRFSRRSPFFTTLEILWRFDKKMVIFFTMLVHDIFIDLWNFTTFSRCLPPVVSMENYFISPPCDINVYWTSSICAICNTVYYNTSYFGGTFSAWQIIFLLYFLIGKKPDYAYFQRYGINVSHLNGSGTERPSMILLALMLQ